MKKLFIHLPLFRVLSPLATGVLVYMLILLVNNNVDAIRESFLTNELYVCIILSYAIQEFTRFSLIALEQRFVSSKEGFRISLQSILSFAFSLAIVSFSMKIYYREVLGFSVNLQELLIFNLAFSFITFTYLLLYKGHQLLYRINVEKLNKEEEELELIRNDFRSYTSKINSRLLFESLEALTVVMKKNAYQAEEITDEFSSIYRYNLMRHGKELVDIKEELLVVDALTKVYENLPYRPVTIHTQSDLSGLVVPGSIMNVVEEVIRSTIVNLGDELIVEIGMSDEFFTIDYEHDERFNYPFQLSLISESIRRYEIYSDTAIRFAKNEKYNQLKLPKIYLS